MHSAQYRNFPIDGFMSVNLSKSYFIYILNVVKRFRGIDCLASSTLTYTWFHLYKFLIRYENIAFFIVLNYPNEERNKATLLKSSKCLNSVSLPFLKRKKLVPCSSLYNNQISFDATPARINWQWVSVWGFKAFFEWAQLSQTFKKGKSYNYILDFFFYNDNLVR